MGSSPTRHLMLITPIIFFKKSKKLISYKKKYFFIRNNVHFIKKQITLPRPYYYNALFKTTDFTKLYFFYADFFLSPGIMLRYHHIYLRSLRKDYLHWSLATKLFKQFTAHPNMISFDPFFLRSRKALRQVHIIEILNIRYKWSGFFFKTKRIKKWLKKKYSYSLWR